MDLLLSEAARLLDKSESQVRYMIKSGQLPARKADGRWRIRREDLPRSAGQLRAAEKKLARAADLAAEVLKPNVARSGKKRLSLHSLRAMEDGAEIYRELVAKLGTDHPAAVQLHEALLLLSCGYYEYSSPEKAAFYGQARQHASRAAGELLLHGEASHESLLGRLEETFMPALGGLVNRAERRQKGR